MNGPEQWLRDFCNNIKKNAPEADHREMALEWMSRAPMNPNDYKACLKIVDEFFKD
jgi:hypothetical protein